MSQKKVKGVKVNLTIKEIQIIENLLAGKAHFLGGFKKLKKSERELWHVFNKICKELKISDYKIVKNFNKFLH